MYRERQKIGFPRKVLYLNPEITGLRGRPRNRWQDKVREDGRLVGGKGWKERVYKREEWKKLLRTARNLRNSAHDNGMNERMERTLGQIRLSAHTAINNASSAES